MGYEVEDIRGFSGMSKDEFLKRLQSVIPNGAQILWSEVTMLTEDFKTMNYDTESDSIEEAPLKEEE